MTDDARAPSSGPAHAGGLSLAERRVVWALAVFGLLDLSALAAVFFPWTWMNAVHQMCGLGDLPRTPIVGYLARTASLLYALHGAMILFAACDVRRYWPLVRFLGTAALVHGALLVLIDVREAMPGWWQAVEGFCIAATGAVVLVLQARADRARLVCSANPLP